MFSSPPPPPPPPKKTSLVVFIEGHRSRIGCDSCLIDLFQNYMFVNGTSDDTSIIVPKMNGRKVFHVSAIRRS